MESDIRAALGATRIASAINFMGGMIAIWIAARFASVAVEKGANLSVAAVLLVTAMHLPAAAFAQTIHDNTFTLPGGGNGMRSFCAGASNNAVKCGGGADEFNVPSGHRWAISEVRVSGTLDRAPDSFSVYFFKDNSGQPGSILTHHEGLTKTDIVAHNQYHDIFTLELSETQQLRPGRYWIGIVAVYDDLANVPDGWAWTKMPDEIGEPFHYSSTGGFEGIAGDVWVNSADFGPDRSFYFQLRGGDSVVTVPTLPFWGLLVLLGLTGLYGLRSVGVSQKCDLRS